MWLGGSQTLRRWRIHSFPFRHLDQFPTFVPPVPLSGNVLDRNIRTPYFHQYNVSVQREWDTKVLLEAAYVGTRGRNLFRQVAINQARLASPQNPVTNDVTGAVITTNTPANALLRAPFQGVVDQRLHPESIDGRVPLRLAAGQSHRRFTDGLQFLAAYTFGKSMDNGSGQGGGAGITVWRIQRALAIPARFSATSSMTPPIAACRISIGRIASS